MANFNVLINRDTKKFVKGSKVSASTIINNVEMLFVANEAVEANASEFIIKNVIDAQGLKHEVVKLIFDSTKCVIRKVIVMTAASGAQYYRYLTNIIAISKEDIQNLSEQVAQGNSFDTSLLFVSFSSMQKLYNITDGKEINLRCVNDKWSSSGGLLYEIDGKQVNAF